jgi:hypothetical protein
MAKRRAGPAGVGVGIGALTRSFEILPHLYSPKSPCPSLNLEFIVVAFP